jgi:hypothetical protein
MIPRQQIEGEPLGIVKEPLGLARFDLGHPLLQQGLEAAVEKARPAAGLGGQPLGAAHQLGGEVVAHESAGFERRRRTAADVDPPHGRPVRRRGATQLLE